MPDRSSSRQGRQSPRAIRWAAAATIALGGCVAALFLAEGALRAVGFSFQTFPLVQFGYPDPVTLHDLFVPDRDLFWVSRNYSEILEGARRNHPAVVFMGDSVTQFGTYPSLTLAQLAPNAPTLATGVKVGVIGWSSEQGLAQLRRDVLPLKPRVITIAFGWNDHWIAMGRPDSDARPGAMTWWLSQHSRVWQLVTKARMARPKRIESRPNRVDVARYESNLETMVRLATDAGIKVVLVTLPSGHQAGHEPQVLAGRFVRHLSDAVPLHRTYVEATRLAARETGATLCDVAAAFEADALSPTYFEKDGIHLKVPGNRALADQLVPCILRANESRALGPTR